MSTGTKIVLALIVLIVLWFLYDIYKKRKDDELQKEKESCTKLTSVEWAEKKRKKKEAILFEQQKKYMEGIMDFYIAYKNPAAENGINSSNPFLVIDFGAWEEAQKWMIEQGYCEQFS